jgi:hypothetical protein
MFDLKAFWCPTFCFFALINPVGIKAQRQDLSAKRQTGDSTGSDRSKIANKSAADSTVCRVRLSRAFAGYSGHHAGSVYLSWRRSLNVRVLDDALSGRGHDLAGSMGDRIATSQASVPRICRNGQAPDGRNRGDTSRV